MNIIEIPFHDYKKWLREGYRTRDAHLCQHFEKREDIEKILIINRPVSLAEILIKRNSWKTPKGREIFRTRNARLIEISHKVYCLDIFIADFFKVIKERKGWWFSAFNYQKVHDVINDTISILNMENSVLLLQNPMAVGVIEKIKYKFWVFDAIDNWIYHPQMKNKEIIANNYNYIDKKANLILTVADSLKDLFKNNKNVYWIPNGVDIEVFKNAKKDTLSEKITIGYVGKIQERVNFDLVELCLKAYPNFKFVFVGPVFAQKDRVRNLKKIYKNIEFLGDVHFSNLTDIMKNFDMCIIPHFVNEFTQSMNPLKVYEYLAAGKVVITTTVSGTSNISEYVFSENSEDEFVERIGVIAKQIKQGKISYNSIVDSIPQECLWEERVNRIVSIFEKFYG